MLHIALRSAPARKADLHPSNDAVFSETGLDPTDTPCQSGAIMASPPGLDRFSKRIPDGDVFERLVCDTCGWIHYDNPKIVVGAIVTWGPKFLLCRRAIEPRQGYWTMPAGFMEQHETTEDGARREAQEEACADIVIDALLGIYNVARISQVHIIYRATLHQPSFAVGPESAEVALFDWQDIPWTELAFPTVHWGLGHHRQVAGQTTFAAFSAPADMTMPTAAPGA